MQATVAGLLGRDTLHARIDEIKKAKGAPPPGEFHRHDRPDGEGPSA